MKKYRYYIMSCVALPFVKDLCHFLHDMRIVEMNFILIVATLAVTSAVIGNLSPTNKIFDYVLPVVSVIGYNCYRFVSGFFSKTDMETRFSIFEAIEWIFVDTSLLISALIAIITFLASFKPIRVVRIIKSPNMDA